MVNFFIFEVVKVIGILVFNFFGVEFGLFYYCVLEYDKISVFVVNVGNYEVFLYFFDILVEELYWWVLYILYVK